MPLVVSSFFISENLELEWYLSIMSTVLLGPFDTRYPRFTSFTIERRPNGEHSVPGAIFITLIRHPHPTSLIFFSIASPSFYRHITITEK